MFSLQAYTSQIVVMVMLALAIGSDTISSQTRREAIIDGLLDLPSKFESSYHRCFFLRLIVFKQFGFFMFESR